VRTQETENPKKGKKKRAGKMVLKTILTGAFNLRIKAFSADSLR